MTPPIQAERLAALFTQLCEIDSPSRKEADIAAFLKQLLRSELAAEIVEDDSALLTGSNCGNLIARFSGSSEHQPIFFSCHLDTVQPGEGVKVRREGGRFTSAGQTVLGADDKAGIAIVIEALRSLRENGIPHAPCEFVLTTCEEVGLLGAKMLDQQLITSPVGYALDSTGTDVAIIGAPAANHIVCEIKGLAAHAGLHPADGISAIQIAAQALAGITLGRLDEESTANIGLISGGTATNIVPDYVRLEGEVRSHSLEKLASYTRLLESQFAKAVSSWSPPPGCSLSVAPSYFFVAQEQYPAMLLTDDDPVIARLDRAAALLGRQLAKKVAGGGSDANIFSSKGRPVAILGIGMTDVHSTDESILLSDMTRTCELVFSLLTC